MGLLDQVLGNFLSGTAGGPSPLQGVLMSMLGGGSQQGGRERGAASAILCRASSRLASVTWLDRGSETAPISPVTPQDLHRVLGENQVQSMANQAGMAPSDFLSQLSQHLPNVVSVMTPNGQLPDEGSVSV